MAPAHRAAIGEARALPTFRRPLAPMAGMLLLLALWVCPRPAGAAEFTNAPSVVVVIGASGEQGYGEEFERPPKLGKKSALKRGRIAS